MSLLRQSKGRSVSYQQVWGSGGDWSEVMSSSVETMMGVSAVFSCVDLLASRVQAMDIDAFRRSSVGTLPSRVDPPAVLANPSDLLSPEEWVYQGVASYLLWGEAIGLVTRRVNGWPASIEWLHPDRVKATAAGATSVSWSYNGRPVDTGDLIIIRYAPMTPGAVRGMSPVRNLRKDIRTAVELVRYQLAFFETGGLPMAVLANELVSLADAEASEVKDRYIAAMRQRGRAPLVIGRGWKFTQTDQKLGDAALDQLERRIATKVANAFHIPPEEVGGDSGSSLTYTNSEMMTAKLDRQALYPIYTLFAKVLSRHLVPPPGFIRFNADSIYRIDVKTRMEIDEKAIRSGYSTVNERRHRNGEASLDAEGADQQLWPPYTTTAPKGTGT